ncbi:MAG: hypothetical protein ACYSW8_31570 [Planctomycetota bacterium]|jgi:hypothetical protein
MLQLSNPRHGAVVEDWPSGKRRVTATFDVEQDPKKGDRVARATTGKPKKTTYHKKMRIVDGDDGRVYLLGFTSCAQIVVWPGTMKYPEYFYDGDEGFAEYFKLLMDAD